MKAQEENGLLYLAYKRGRYTFIFGLLTSALMVAALWPIIEHAKLSLWLAAMYVIQSLNFLLARHYLRHGHGVAAELAKWKAAFVIASAVSGLGWGVSILIFPTHPFDLAYLLSLFVIAGVSAFASVSKAPVIPATVVFLLMSLSPLALSLLSTGKSVHSFAGAIVVSYLLSMLLLSRQMNTLTRTSLALAELNKGLSASVQESNQRMSQYFKNAPGFFHTLLRYPDGRYVMPFASEAIRDLLGIVPGEVENDFSHIIALTHPDDAARVSDMVKESAQNLVPYHAEYRIIHPQKGMRWIGVHSSPQRMPDGGTRWDGYMFDITERKEIEAQLERREHELHALVENAPDIILRYDRQCRLYFANAQFEVALGGSIAPFLGKTPVETVADGRYDLYEAAIRRVISCGNDAESTLTMLDRYGEESIHHVRITAERDESGKVGGVFVIGRDITERKKMEETLAAQERKFRQQAQFQQSLLSGLRDAGIMLVVVENGKFVYTNDHYVGCQLGYAAEALPANVDFIALIHPDDRPRIAGMHRDRLAGKPVPNSYEIGALGGDGTRLEYEFHVTVVPDTDPPQTLLLTLRIDERKRMQVELAERERDFRNLAESSPDSIIRYDLDHRILYLNSMLVRELQLAGADEVLGKRLSEVWPDGRFAVIDDAARRVVASGDMENIELVWPQEDGTVRYGQITVVPERDAGGQIIGTLAFGRNITAIRATERRLNSLVENLPGIAYTFRLSPDGGMSFPYVSAGVEDIYGLKPEQAMGDAAAIHSLAHPDDRPRIEAGIAESARTMTPYRVESRVCRPGHAERWLDVSAVPRLEPDGSMLWDGIMLDITERKRAAEAREESERRMVRYFASTPGYFQMTELRADGSFAVPFASDGIVDLFGIKSDDVKENVAALAALNHPDDMEMIFSKAAESARDLTPYQIEYRIFHPHKGLRWIECIGSPERLPDGGTRWYGFMHDITERKRAQQQMELLDRAIDMSADAVYLIDSQLRFVYVNDGACRALGCSREELLAMGPGDIDDTQMPRAQMQAIMDNSPLGLTISFEARHRARDGRSYPVEISGVHFEEGGKKFGLTVARDITERKRIELELAVREREFRTLAENSPDVIVRYDRELRRIYMNPAWEAANGISIEEALGKRPSEMAVVVSASAREFEDRLREVLASGQPGEIEFGGKDSAGNMKYFSMRVVPEHDEYGAVSGLLTMANDITERKRVENELRHNREMLANAQKIARLGSWDWDVVTNRVEWSEMAYEIYTPDKRPAEPGFEDFTSSLHPDDRERVVAAVQSTFEHDTPFDLDHRVVSASRGVRTVHAYGQVFRDADGKPVRMVGTVQDITERKRTELELEGNLRRISDLNLHLEQNARDLEEQAVELEMSKEQLQQTEAWYRSILQSAPDGMLVVDERGRIIQVNAQLEAMFGYGSGELSGCSIEVLLPQAVRPSHEGMRNAFIASGERDRRMAGAIQDLFGCRKDGSEFPVDVSLSRLPDIDGRVGATCAAVRDVSERRKMDVAREAALSEALRLAQLRSAFMAQMSHELRTPLNGILGYTQNLLLQSNVLGEKQVSWLHIIQNSGEHLLSLINGILDHAAIEADKFELISGDIELEPFLGAIIGMIRVRAEQKNLAFNCEVDANLPAVVRGDAQRLRQILLNLLSNAVKFTDSGQVALRVSCIPPLRLHFVVQDSGVGIAADQFDNIFLPFEQIGEISRRAGGSGLGLSISRKLVQLMGGDIKVESVPGTGSTFSFEIDMEAGLSRGATVNAVALAEQAATLVAQAIPMLSVPSKQELDILHANALRGSMRDVMRHAEQLAEADSRYLPFADQLRRLAKSFQTKALVGLIEQYRKVKELEQ